MARSPIRVGLNLLPDAGYRLAALPLFERGLVDAIEWDIDERWGYGWGNRRLPLWVNRLLDLYAHAGALYGHGVWLSVLSAEPEARQERWFMLLARECARRAYRHVSEHLGFMTAGSFVQGTMFPAPLSAETVAVGRAKMDRLARATGRPVGLENWPLALGLPDLLDQGTLLEEVLAPTGGVLVLDLHNLHAQATNLGYPVERLFERLPLARARELHISGGSWFESRSQPARAPVRLDSHDGPVPEAVFALVPYALERCPNLEVAFLERRGNTLATDGERGAYVADFLRLRELVTAHEARRVRAPSSPSVPPPLGATHAANPPVARTARDLAAFQAMLLDLLARDIPAERVAAELRASAAGAAYADYVAAFDPRLVEASMALFAIWGGRTDPEHEEYRRAYVSA